MGARRETHRSPDRLSERAEAMIFMSQSGLIVETRKDEWDRWYQDHLRIMVTVPGIASAQRFATDHRNWPPSLAMYTVASASVFEDAYYQQVRGMGCWLPLIDTHFYRRVLFDGLPQAPAVPSELLLAVTDQPRPRGDLYGVPFLWLKAVGLDQSISFRGIAVVASDSANGLGDRDDVALYRPLTARYESGR
ncbi:conserved hypothetical protein [Cupriavidus taiwanensis]|nr:conserved hypothetical protein [Cupriavidus taiwanensis]